MFKRIVSSIDSVIIVYICILGVYLFQERIRPVFLMPIYGNVEYFCPVFF